MVSLKSLLLLGTALASPILAAPTADPAPQDISTSPITSDPSGNGDGSSVIIFPLPNKPSGPFNGTGQIRTRWYKGNYADLGCLTREGRWTVDESLCGVFKADRRRPAGYEIDIWYLKSKAGNCRIYAANFLCDKGGEGTEFGPWLWPTAIPGTEVLRWGQYGLMANWLRNPPLRTDDPQEIHLVGYSEPGQYVWLTWSPLKDKAW